MCCVQCVLRVREYKARLWDVRGNVERHSLPALTRTLMPRVSWLSSTRRIRALSRLHVHCSSTAACCAGSCIGSLAHIDLQYNISQPCRCMVAITLTQLAANTSGCMFVSDIGLTTTFEQPFANAPPCYRFRGADQAVGRRRREPQPYNGEAALPWDVRLLLNLAGWG